MEYEVLVQKKDGTIQPFIPDKIATAARLAAARALVELSDDDIQSILDRITVFISLHNLPRVTVPQLHNLVELGLDAINPEAAKCYRDYRNYKTDFVHMLDKIYKKAQSLQYIADKENSNTDSALVSTKRSLIYNYLSKELYKKFFLNVEERQAINEGYIYIHDMSARRDTMNCCLFDMERVLKGGFEMGNLWYNEPKTLEVAFDVIGDVILSTASQQYGGFTVPEIDTILSYYAEKSYKKYYEDEEKYLMHCLGSQPLTTFHKYEIDKKVTKRIIRDVEQGMQGLEYKLNSVGSSRGDYPFVTITFGHDTTKWGTAISSAILRVHKEGQGREGYKKAVLFPKLVFLYDEELHGNGKELDWLFEEALQCSAKSMYPDYLSLSGDSLVAKHFKETGAIISPMGCRAFLSPWKDPKTGEWIAKGRWNAGAVSLHLPMIYQKAKEAGKDFYEVLDYYLDLIRKLHRKTHRYLSNIRASVNPVAFCQGGFYNGYLKPRDKIAPLMEYVTFSFGITALNELQQLHNKKSLVQDNKFAKEVMLYINEQLAKFKEEDHMLYAIYGTPAESLCGLQVKQFRELYGVIENVSDREYVSNSFHCHVTEQISPILKQNKEKEFWDMFNGGKIQYVRYPLNYNIDAMRSIVRRAMNMGFYEGVNLSLAYCEDCGHEEIDMNICPVCGSSNLTKIDRMNGYLSYSRVHGDTRLNEAKMSEIKERISM